MPPSQKRGNAGLTVNGAPVKLWQLRSSVQASAAVLLFFLPQKKNPRTATHPPSYVRPEPAINKEPAASAEPAAGATRRLAGSNSCSCSPSTLCSLPGILQPLCPHRASLARAPAVHQGWFRVPRDGSPRFEQGSRMPAAAYDVTAGKDMPTWSTSLFAVCDSPQVAACAIVLPHSFSRLRGRHGADASSHVNVPPLPDAPVRIDWSRNMRNARPRSRCVVWQRMLSLLHDIPVYSGRVRPTGAPRGPLPDCALPRVAVGHCCNPVLAVQLLPVRVALLNLRQHVIHNLAEIIFQEAAGNAGRDILQRL